MVTLVLQEELIAGYEGGALAVDLAELVVNAMDDGKAS